ncbi:MAG: phage shock protein A [Limisphaerales bacterium]|jgi:phage shock protein A
MFKAIGRWFKAVGYFVTGNIDAARGTVDTSPATIRAQYDSIVRDKLDQIQTYKKAVAGLIAQQENKIARLKESTGGADKLDRLKAGALAKAKQTVVQLQKAGLAKEEIHANPEYQKCLAAFNDFSSTLKEQNKRIGEIEGDIEEYDTSIANHKVQLQQLIRDVEKIRSESHEAVAEVITAKQEKELADTISGIATDGSAEELQRIRQMRQELKAEARVSKELAGTDSMAQEAEFLAYASKSASSDEFDSLIGLGESAASDKSKEQGNALPE